MWPIEVIGDLSQIAQLPMRPYRDIMANDHGLMSMKIIVLKFVIISGCLQVEARDRSYSLSGS